MRVIAGEARRAKLIAPKGFETRPTSDKTKETLFNVLAPYIGYDTAFLDLFSGSGAIGIEALSRGAKKAVFVEKGREAISCIEVNIKTCRFEEHSRVIKRDALSALNILNGNEKFDIIFMDPPFDQGLEEGCLRFIAGSALLKEEGIIIVEASNETELDYLEEIGLCIFKEKIYKNNKHVFIKEKTDDQSNLSR